MFGIDRFPRSLRTSDACSGNPDADVIVNGVTKKRGIKKIEPYE